MEAGVCPNKKPGHGKSDVLVSAPLNITHESWRGKPQADVLRSGVGMASRYEVCRAPNPPTAERAVLQM